MNRNAPPENLSGFPELLWRELDAAEDGWRAPVLASRADTGADARVVVLREAVFSERRLTFFTDRRSLKYRQLCHAPDVCLVFYDRERSLQVRCFGAARLCADDPWLDAGWNSLRDVQRAMYAANAPGEVLGERSDLMHFKEKGRENFAAFDVIVDRFRCLWLSLDGNAAARFEWNGRSWSSHWEAP